VTDDLFSCEPMLIDVCTVVGIFKLPMRMVCIPFHLIYINSYGKGGEGSGAQLPPFEVKHPLSKLNPLPSCGTQ